MTKAELGIFYTHTCVFCTLNCTPFWSFAGHLTISLKIILRECKSICFSHYVLLTMMCAIGKEPSCKLCRYVIRYRQSIGEKGRVIFKHVKHSLRIQQENNRSFVGPTFYQGSFDLLFVHRKLIPLVATTKFHLVMKFQSKHQKIAVSGN